MQQRQARLGDIVDDYCPRERRVTNHAVVAMVGDAVKQTRCTTCEAEHEFKQAKVPPQRRKKEEGGVLYQQVLAGMPRKPPGLTTEGADASVPPGESEPEPGPTPALETADSEHVEESPGGADESVHRPLIRATFPRLSDEPPQRREPEFTMRTPQHAPRGKFGGKSGFRGPRSGAQGFGGNGSRPSGPKRHGQGHGPGNRPGGGPPGPSAHGNRGPRPGGHGQGRGGGKKSPR